MVAIPGYEKIVPVENYHECDSLYIILASVVQELAVAFKNWNKRGDTFFSFK